MAAHKGCAKTGGRAKGVRNKNTFEIKEAARLHGPEAIKKLLFLMRHGENETVQLAAANGLLDRGFGRPAQAVAVGGPDGGPVVVMVCTGVPRPEIEGEIVAIPHLPGTPKSDA